MKKLLYLVLIVSCSSCSLFKNVSKKVNKLQVDTDSTGIQVKKDSAQLSVKQDSAISSSTTIMDTHTEVSEIDTTVVMPEHNSAIVIEPPVDSTRYQYDDGIVQTTVSKQGGKLHIDTRVKERPLPVKGKKTTTDQHLESKTDAKAGSQTIALRQGSFDSSASKLLKTVKGKTVDKESTVSVKGVLLFVFLIVLFAFLIWRFIVFWNGGKFLVWPLFKSKNTS